MKKNKQGFTLVEVLVCTMIIGIIVALSLSSIRTVRNSYPSLAYFTHKNIVDIVGVLYSGNISSAIKVKHNCTPGTYYAYGKKCSSDSYYYTDENITNDSLKYQNTWLPAMTTRCVNSNQRTLSVLKNDYEWDSMKISCYERPNAPMPLREDDINLFCKSFSALTNINGKYNCTNLYDVGTDEDEPYISNLDVDRPNFTLTNGMRYYITNWLKDESVSSDYGFRLIAVDLNGKKLPNRTTGTMAHPADIVTFLILDNGEVFPLGVAADNFEYGGKTIRYINAEIKGYYFGYGTGEKDEHGKEIARDRGNATPKVCNRYNCNLGVYSVEYPQYSGMNKVSYRQAFCGARKNKDNAYTNYCLNLTHSQKCPPTNQTPCYDMCRVQTIKPAFRYSL